MVSCGQQVGGSVMAINKSETGQVRAVTGVGWVIGCAGRLRIAVLTARGRRLK